MTSRIRKVALTAHITGTLSWLGAIAGFLALAIGSPVLHASAAVLALLVNTILSIYKPRGMTAYGRNKVDRHWLPVKPPVVLSSIMTALDRERAKRAPRWLYVLGIHAIGLVVLFLIVHLRGGVMGH
jgi:hypothetical protein